MRRTSLEGAVAALDAASLEAASLDAASLDAASLEAASLDAASLEAEALASLEAAELEADALEADALEALPDPLEQATRNSANIAANTVARRTFNVVLFFIVFSSLPCPNRKLKRRDPLHRFITV